MTMARMAPVGTAFPALGTTAVVLVTEPAALGPATGLLRDGLAAADAAYSRFRADSELMRLVHGRAAPVGPLLGGALAAALRAAEATDGLVDLTVGRAVATLGYDRDFASVPQDQPQGGPAEPAPGWWRIMLDSDASEVLIPHGVLVDLGATGKAYAADLAAERIAADLDIGVLVSLGGDLATAGPAPEGGWLVGISDDHRGDGAPADPVVTIRSGALATSGTANRRWRRGGRTVHHIVDPRTGDVPPAVWRTVTVAAATCVDANTAATAALVRGADAADWLTGLGLPARLVRTDGTVVTAAGWSSTGGGAG